jgi:hypothetical protein
VPVTAIIFILFVLRKPVTVYISIVILQLFAGLSSGRSSSTSSHARESVYAHKRFHPGDEMRLLSALPRSWKPENFSTRADQDIPNNSKRCVFHRHWGSSLRFFVNGVDQGIAFVHLTKQGQTYTSNALSCSELRVATLELFAGVAVQV